MEKRNVSLLDLEKKIDNYNEKEDILKKMKFNKPDMNINNLNNKFNKDNLLSFLNNLYLLPEPKMWLLLLVQELTLLAPLYI